MADVKFTEDELADILGAIHNRVILANEDGSIADLLSRWGFPDLLPEDGADEFDRYDERPDGDIIVLGDLQIQKEHLLGLAETLGISKNRFQFRDYNEVKNRSCRVWRDNTNIAVILCGAAPHKAAGMGDYSSLVVALKNDPGYPPVHEFRQGNGALKITKSVFKEALWKLMNDGIVRAA